MKITLQMRVRLRQYLFGRVGLLRYHRHLPLHAPHSRPMFGICIEARALLAF
jgi:hypothetical protein